ncbi:MAG: hypothetical protein K8T90_18520 [Planctomycetes bacterium]|nr:hypothetical protein [Planctomycetota bacterium]
MSAAKWFVSGFVAAAALAAAGWALRVRPAFDEAARRASDAEELTRRARRETSDAQLWAESERERNRLNEDRVKELERTLSAVSASRPSDPASGGGEHGKAMPSELKPEDWDRTRLNQEIENLTLAPVLAERHQRFPLVVRGLRARPDEAVDLLTQVLGADLGASYVAVAANLAASLGDERMVPPLAARWNVEKETGAQRAIFRALANIPSDQTTPALVAVWSDTGGDPELRRLAIHGLGLRGHKLARSAADGTGGAPPAQRIRAIESLRECAQRGGWSDASLAPVFARALRTADGPPQRKLALIALEGLRSNDTLPALDAFAADAASPPELAARAKRLAASMRAGESRPEGAGIPERGLAEDADQK